MSKYSSPTQSKSDTRERTPSRDVVSNRTSVVEQLLLLPPLLPPLLLSCLRRQVVRVSYSIQVHSCKGIEVRVERIVPCWTVLQANKDKRNVRKPCGVCSQGTNKHQACDDHRIYCGLHRLSFLKFVLLKNVNIRVVRWRRNVARFCRLQVGHFLNSLNRLLVCSPQDLASATSNWHI